ncbi:MAG: Ig-like domain-containing protein, partial [Planctomycetaceae bacterium]
VYNFTVINVPTPVPQLVDLVAVTDSGRHDSDDVTFHDGILHPPATQYDIILDDDRIDEFLNLNLLADATADDAFTLGADYVVEVFNNGISIGFAHFVGGNTWRFNATPGDLAEGHNNFISAAVRLRDRANPSVNGRGELSEALQVTLDTIRPPVSFGQPGVAGDGLKADSDSGVVPNPDTFVDLATNDRTPTFWGGAEADAIVRVFADVNNNGVIDLGTDIFLGQTTAVPLDGDEAEPDGFWEIESVIDLNNPNFFPRDGLRQILVSAEDLPGNVNNPGDGVLDVDQVLRIFLDTQGPQVTNVFITDAPAFNLFALKPNTASPTPRVDSLTISFQDLPPRVAGFLLPALKDDVALTPGQFLLVGDANGVIPIADINLVQTIGPDGVARAAIELVFFEPLPDDRFTLTVSDSLVDRAGNALDGESNAIEPVGTPLFPSGDGVPGGEFVARFTVDSRPEVGAVGQRGIFIDINGNMHFDPTNLDFVNRDLVFDFPVQTDAIFAGQFVSTANKVLFIGNEAGGNDGFERLGAYGLVGGQFRWLLDFNNDGVFDYSAVSGVQVNGLPFAGDFIPFYPGDEIGLFDGRTVYLDTNGDNNIGAGDRVFATNMRGLPIVGDFDGDGVDDLASHEASSETLYFDLSSAGLFGLPDGVVDWTFSFGFPGVLERPVAGDLNLDGIDDVGLFVPSQSGLDEGGEWYFLISDETKTVPGTAQALTHAFSPKPLGRDLFIATFGGNASVPLLGNFDPPVAPDDPPHLQNDAPLVNAISSQSVEVGRTLSFTVVASDPDGDVLRYQLANPPLGARIDSAGRFTWTPTAEGTWSVRVQVIDGRHVSYADFNVTATDPAPVLAPIADQTISPSQDALEIALSASDDDPLVLTAIVAESAAAARAMALQAQYGFQHYHESDWYNAHGHQEKWLRGSPGGVAGYYFIRPNGWVQHYRGRFDQPIVAVVDPAVWADLSLLVDAMGRTSANATASISGNVLTLDPAEGFTGTLGVYVSASDGRTTVGRSFTLTVANRAPEIAPIADRLAAPGETVEIALSVSDADGDSVSLSATVFGSAADADVHRLRGEYGRFLDYTGGHYWNHAYPGRKYVAANDGQTTRYFYLT